MTAKKRNSKVFTLTPTHQILRDDLLKMETNRPVIGLSNLFSLFTGRMVRGTNRKLAGEHLQRPLTYQNLIIHCAWKDEERKWIEDQRDNGNEVPKRIVQFHKRGEINDFEKKFIKPLRERYKDKFYLYAVPEMGYKKDQDGKPVFTKTGQRILALIPVSRKIALEYLKGVPEHEAQQILHECAMAAVWITHVLFISTKHAASEEDSLEYLGDWIQEVTEDEIKLITTSSKK